MLLVILFALLNPFSREDVRQSYIANYEQPLTIPSGWTGSVEGGGHNQECDPGTVDPEFDDGTLRLLNWGRRMAGRLSVEDDLPNKGACASCATGTMANQELRHTVPLDWDCVTPEGIEAARWSLISATAGPRAACQFLHSPFHRQFVLWPPIVTMGIGSVGERFFGRDYFGATCILVARGNQFDAGRRDNLPTRWPTSGYFPFQACPSVFYWSWSPGLKSPGTGIQFFNSVEVTVTDRWGGNIPLAFIANDQMVVEEQIYADPFVWFLPMINNYDPQPDTLFWVDIEAVLYDGTFVQDSYPVIFFDATVFSDGIDGWIFNGTENWIDYD